MDFFSFFKPSKPNILKEMGFVNDQDGIIDRYAREKNGWDIHLNNSKQTILKAVEFHQPTTIAILGSGWLLDVPIEELSAKCQKVYLYDIVHPAQIRHKVSKFKNIGLIETDVTGGSIQTTWELVQKYKSGGTSIDLTTIPGQGFIPQQPVDMIVSLNILNQLDILICDYLLESSNLQNEDLQSLRIAIQQKHIESLQKKAFCLISDVEEIVTDLTDNSSKTRPLVLAELPQTNHCDQWLWQFDTTGNYYEDKSVSFTVKALF